MVDCIHTTVLESKPAVNQSNQLFMTKLTSANLAVDGHCVHGSINHGAK